VSKFFGELIVAEQVTRLPSKIVQVEEIDCEHQYVAWMLCEDGSVWIYDDKKSTYRNVHPPHQPPTQSSDVFEAVDSLLKKYGLEPYRTQKT
jgi:hypothetical protein